LSNNANIYFITPYNSSLQLGECTVTFTVQLCTHLGWKRTLLQCRQTVDAFMRSCRPRWSNICSIATVGKKAQLRLFLSMPWQDLDFFGLEQSPLLSISVKKVAIFWIEFLLQYVRPTKVNRSFQTHNVTILSNGIVQTNMKTGVVV